MEEIKEILIGMQGQMNGMQNQMNNMQVSFEQKLEEGLQNVKEELHKEIVNIKEEMKQDIQKAKKEIRKEVQEAFENIEQEMQYLENNLTNKIDVVNQRLAVYQHDVTEETKALFDADETRKELLDIHDSEICDIKQEQFEHTLKINRLEQKVIGA